MTVTSEGSSHVSVMHRRPKLCSAKDSTTKHTLFLIDLILKCPHLKGLLERVMHFFEEPKSVFSMTLFLSGIITGQSRLEAEWWHLSAGLPKEGQFTHFRTLLSGQFNNVWGPAQKNACRRGILCWAPLFGVTKFLAVMTLSDPELFKSAATS